MIRNVVTLVHVIYCVKIQARDLQIERFGRISGDLFGFKEQSEELTPLWFVYLLIVVMQYIGRQLRKLYD